MCKRGDRGGEWFQRGNGKIIHILSKSLRLVSLPSSFISFSANEKEPAGMGRKKSCSGNYFCNRKPRGIVSLAILESVDYTYLGKSWASPLPLQKKSTFSWGNILITHCIWTIAFHILWGHRLCFTCLTSPEAGQGVAQCKCWIKGWMTGEWGNSILNFFQSPTGWQQLPQGGPIFLCEFRYMPSCNILWIELLYFKNHYIKDRIIHWR